MYNTWNVANAQHLFLIFNQIYTISLQYYIITSLDTYIMSIAILYVMLYMFTMLSTDW